MGAARIKTEKIEGVSNIVDAFKDLITINVEPKMLRKYLTQLYFSHSRLLIKDNDRITNDSDSELYYLSELIEILDQCD